MMGAMICSPVPRPPVPFAQPPSTALPEIETHRGYPANRLPVRVFTSRAYPENCHFKLTTAPGLPVHFSWSSASPRNAMLSLSVLAGCTGGCSDFPSLMLNSW
jgi:hypothetical protein